MKNRAAKRVSVLIPTYNGRHLLEQHLPAVIDCLREADEIVIVDDCGTDTTRDYLTKKFALIPSSAEKMWEGKVKGKHIKVTLVQTQRNLRFAGACNVGAQIAGNELIFLLNNDVSPEKDVLQYLIPYFDEPDCFAVGCKEYEQDRSGEVSGRNLLWFERGRFMHSKARSMTSGKTAWVSGGSGLFDREKWVLLGGFDTRFYPAYWEDIDLSFRAQNKGWKVLFEEKAVVFHKHESTHVDVFGQKRIDRMSLKNGTAFIVKHATGKQYLQYLLWKPYWFVRLFKMMYL